MFKLIKWSGESANEYKIGQSVTETELYMLMPCTYLYIPNKFIDHIPKIDDIIVDIQCDQPYEIWCRGILLKSKDKPFRKLLDLSLLPYEIHDAKIINVTYTKISKRLLNTVIEPFHKDDIIHYDGYYYWGGMIYTDIGEKNLSIDLKNILDDETIKRNFL